MRVGESRAAPVADDEKTLHPDTVRLRARLSPARWQHVLARARERVEILEMTAQRRGSHSESWQSALNAVAPEVGWSRCRHWKRCAARRAGQAWERQLDERVPPEPYRVSAWVREAACRLRRADPSMNGETAQRQLVAQFGAEAGHVSAASLRRIWHAAGLSQASGRPRVRTGMTASPLARVVSKEEVVRLYGGGGLAFLAAAAMETGIARELSVAVLSQAERAVASQTEVLPNEEPTGRSEAGRFTAAYNRSVRGDPLDVDPRRRPDAVKRARRSLATLRVVRSRPDTVGLQLLSLGVVPLVTEARGFDGVDGPGGGWLLALGDTAYKAATLDRALAELALLDVGGALWAAHAQQWARLTRPWSEGQEQPRWLRWVAYIDATQDPYWTRYFALSGKVSRVGRVMPCLTRVALMGGPGVPLWVETRAGTVSLKKELLPFLARFESVMGAGELGRLTIVDAEMATAGLLTALSQREGKWFITVLKGSALRSAKRSDEGPWQPYRERDLVREVKLHIRGKDAPPNGLCLRGIEMQRAGSRHPNPTLFVSNAEQGDLTTEEIPSAYISRWPHQEDRFRETRNGIGMERSHGYSGEMVAHVALSTAQEETNKRVERAIKALESAKASEGRAVSLLEATVKGEGYRASARENVVRAARHRKNAERAQAEAQQKRDDLSTIPREIYVRDTTRDSLVICLKMTVLMLIEYVLKEYFGGARMEARTFIEHFVRLPVTIRRSPTMIVYQIVANLRSPDHTRWLRAACEEATRRNLRIDDRSIRFEALPPLDG